MTTPNIEELIERLHSAMDDNQFEDTNTALSDAATTLQSQAERIAELDSLAANAIVAAADSQKACMKLLDEDLALRAELADMAVNIATYEHLVGLANDTATRLLKERDALRAQLAAIDASEPVAIVADFGIAKYNDFVHRNGAWSGPYKNDDPLFTHPMPAQDVTELVERLGKVNVGLLDGITKAKGCFKAANFEGLPEALAETTDERLKDLVERRLLYVPDYLETALSNAKGVKL